MSRVYGCVPRQVFEGLAQEAVSDRTLTLSPTPTLNTLPLTPYP